MGGVDPAPPPTGFFNIDFGAIFFVTYCFCVVVTKDKIRFFDIFVDVLPLPVDFLQYLKLFLENSTKK